MYMLQDGAEYDEYGNRKKYGSGHRRESAGSGTLPRGYDRGWITSQLQLFASRGYKMSIKTRGKSLFWQDNGTVCFKG